MLIIAILGISLGILILLLTAQVVTIWRGRTAYGGWRASQQALAMRNEAEFHAVLCRLATMPPDALCAVLSDERTYL